jgi:hypothetical protein
MFAWRVAHYIFASVGFLLSIVHTRSILFNALPFIQSYLPSIIPLRETIAHTFTQTHMSAPIEHKDCCDDRFTFLILISCSLEGIMTCLLRPICTVKGRKALSAAGPTKKYPLPSKDGHRCQTKTINQARPCPSLSACKGGQWRSCQTRKAGKHISSKFLLFSSPFRQRP